MVYAGLNRSAAEPVQVPLTGVSSGPGGGTRAKVSAPRRAWRRRSAPCRRRSTPSPARRTTPPRPTARSACSACRTRSPHRLQRQRELDRLRHDRGHWYYGPHQVDVNTAFLTETGTAVGDRYTLASGGRHVTVTIAGEVFDPRAARRR